MKVLRKKVDMFKFSLYVIMKSIREELMSLSLNLGTGMSPSPYMMNPMNYSALGNTPYQQYMFNQQAMQAQMQQPQPQIPQQSVQMPQMRAPDFTGSFVESYEEVKSYPIPINGVLLLMNKNSNRFYIKTLNDVGVPVVKTFEFNELLSNENEEAQDNIETTSNNNSNIEERVSLLERTVASYKAMLLDKFKNNTGLSGKEETK